MGPFRSKRTTRASGRRVEMAFIAILLLQFSAPLGQGRVIFQDTTDNLSGPTDFQVPEAAYAKIAKIQTETTTSLDDVQLDGNVAWSQGAGTRDVSGSSNSDGSCQPCSSSPEPKESKGALAVGLIAILILFAVAAGVVLSLVFIIYFLFRRIARLTAITKKFKIDMSKLDHGPQNFKYKDLSIATKKFSSNNFLGSGGFGSVYKGRLMIKGVKERVDVAVKRISATSSQGAQEFLAEVKIIGQAQHRNLVRLLGWCHERNELLLVYDFMPNGSLDHHLYKSGDHGTADSMLTWSRRLKIVSGVAAALTYLHEEWEYRVIHRDVKSSNVMLDSEFNARLGDFGLARMSEHNELPHSTLVLAGTHGYMAPELFQTLKANEKTDVYSFGAVALEVATGKIPILSVEDRKRSDQPLLVDWVWDLYRDSALLDAADKRLENAFDQGEMLALLKIGLLCSHPNPEERPTMREVINIWKGLSPFPALPHSKPIPAYTLCADYSTEFETGDAHRTTMISTGESDKAGLLKDYDGEAKTIPSVDATDSLLPGTFSLENTSSSSLRRREFSSSHTPLPF